MENSPFNNLSAELRNRIWEYTITTDPNPLLLGTEQGKQPAISRACTQTRKETLLMFYARNSFKVQIDANVVPTRDVGTFFEQADVNLKGMNMWLQRLPRSTQELIPKLIVEVMVVGGFRYETSLAEPDQWDMLRLQLKYSAFSLARQYRVLRLSKWTLKEQAERGDFDEWHDQCAWAKRVEVMLFRDCLFWFNHTPRRP